MGNKVKKMLKEHVSFEKVVTRFVLVWTFLCTIEAIWLNRQGINMMSNLGGIPKISLPIHMVFLAVLFLVAYFAFENMEMPNMEKIILFLFVLVYALICVQLNTDFYFMCGVILVMGATSLYCMKKVDLSRWDIPKRTYMILAVLLAVFFVWLLGRWAVVRYRSYGAPNFDFGIFSQMFHYMKTHFTMQTTVERDGLLSHMKVHVSPIYWILLPFYYIYPHPETLQVLQMVVLASALIPLIGICKNHSFNRLQTLFVEIIYLFWPVIGAGCNYDIHENCFLPVGILWLIYAFEKDSTLQIYLAMIFTLLIKEDAAIYVAVIALYMILEKKMYRKGGAVLLLAIAYFVLAVNYLDVYGTGTLTFRYDNIIYEKNGSMLGILKTFLVNPGYIIKQLMNQSNFNFLLQVFVPLLFLPLCMNKWERIVLFIPMVMFNLLPNYEYAKSIHYQYVFGSGILILYVLLSNIGDMKREWQDIFLVMVAVSCVVSFVSVMGNKSDLIDRYEKSYMREKYDKIDAALSMISDYASVTATTFLCPHLANRDVLYELHYTKHTKETDYVALDLRVATTEYSEQTYLNDPNYEVVYYEPMCVGVFKRISNE